MKLIKKTSLIILGNFLLAFGIVAFILPLEIISGGCTGIALIIRNFIEIDVSTVVFIINIFMFIIGYIVLGKEFSAGTLVSSFMFPIFLSALERIPALQTITNDILLSSIYAGLTIGIGMGLVLREGASTGGMDIPPLILSKYTNISVGMYINLFDGLILAGLMLFNTIEIAMYGILVVFISTILIDKLMLLGSTQVQVTVISNEYEAVKDVVFDRLNRGCTFINITTGYTKTEQKAVMVVLPIRQLHEFNEFILQIDPYAFIISNETHSVKGRGFSLPSLDT